MGCRRELGKRIGKGSGCDAFAIECVWSAVLIPDGQQKLEYQHSVNKILPNTLTEVITISAPATHKLL